MKQIVIPFVTSISNKQTTLAIALSKKIYIRIESQEDAKILWNGIELEETSIFYRNYERLCNQKGKQWKGCNICCDSNINQFHCDLQVIFGILVANEHFSLKLNKYEIFEICIQQIQEKEIIAPILFGSLCTTMYEPEIKQLAMLRYLVNLDYRFCFISLKDTTNFCKENNVVIDAVEVDALLAKAFEIGNCVVLSKIYHNQLGRNDDARWVQTVLQKKAIGFIRKKEYIIAIVENQIEAERFQQEVISDFAEVTCEILKVQGKGYFVLGETHG